MSGQQQMYMKSDGGYSQQPPSVAYGAGPQNFQVMMAPPAMMGAQPTYLCWSVVSLILLCLPLGIPAVIMSALAGDDFRSGRFIEGNRKAATARVLNIVATVFGVLLWVVGIVLIILAFTVATSIRIRIG